MSAGGIKQPVGGLTPDEHRRAGELFGELFGELQQIGLAEDGSSTRLAWTREAAEAARWFDATANRLGLTPTSDRNGNRWAWSAPADKRPVILTGSHLDTVPRGGRFDGALGVAAGLIAVSIVLERGNAGRPLAVVSFADEEGGRFNTPTLGSRLLVGALAPEAVAGRTDGDGVTLSNAILHAGLRPDEMGRDPATLDRIACLLELHVEQGTLLGEVDKPIGIATSILPHGRWRVDLAGEANHGGTTAMSARHDPMPALAEVLQAGRRLAERERSLVTVGKVNIWPNAPTSIAERVSAWLDVRSEDDGALDRIVDGIGVAAGGAAAAQGVEFELAAESRTPEVRFSEELAERITLALEPAGIEPVQMSTAAGHDAGVLASVVPTAMLFVRNQTGISHAAGELASDADCVAGIGALAAVLDELRTDNTESTDDSSEV